MHRGWTRCARSQQAHPCHPLQSSSGRRWPHQLRSPRLSARQPRRGQVRFRPRRHAHPEGGDLSQFDPRPSRSREQNELLHALVSQVLADGKDIDITLVYLAPAPPPDTNLEIKWPRDLLSNVSLPPTDMELDVQAKIKQPSTTKFEPATPSPSTEESLYRAAADAVLSGMIGTEHHPEETLSPN